MIPRKLKVFFAFFPYGGNGASASEHPSIRTWFARVAHQLKMDERVAGVEWNDFNDTPITMTRNAAVLEARRRGADVLVMVDSDQHPDHALDVLGDPTAKPFIASSFDKLYEHWEKGPLIILAPYCGAPISEENVFVFRWTNRISDNPNADWKLEPYSRFEAQQKIGFEEVGAGPTGLIMYDMRIFDILEPKEPGDKPWFYYEYRDLFQGEKVSTEDVTFTRDASLMGSALLGYNPVLCNWDAWAGHYKPKCVSKPSVYTADKVAQKHARAYLEAVNGDWREMHVGAGDGPAIDVPPEIIKKFLQLGGKLPNGSFAVPEGSIAGGVYAPEDFGVKTKPDPRRYPEIGEKHYHPLPEVEAEVQLRVPKKTTMVVDFGGNKTHRFARATQTCGREGQKKCDFDSDRLPYKNGQVNFAYCRHTVEDLGNPAHFLKELQRVAKRGYIETPSPMAELTRGVAGTIVGYVHHRWIVWSENGVLNLIPKYPIVDSQDFFAGRFAELLNNNKLAWNTYHHFSGPLKFKVWEHEKDFDISKPETYVAVLERACQAAMSAQAALPKRPEPEIANPEPSGQINFLGCLTPPADLLVLQKLVKDQISRVDEGQTVHCADLGSWVGSSAIAMAQAGEQVHVRCIDHFQGNKHDRLGEVAARLSPDQIEAELIRNAQKCGVADRVIVTRGDIMEAVNTITDEAFHLAYLDAEHDYQSVKRQIEAWMPKVKKNGILCGHDYSDQFPGVKQAVDELTANGIIVRNEGNVWWTRVGHVCLGRAPQTFAAAR